MINDSIERLRYILTILPPKISSIPEEDFSKKTSPDKWSKKEILGHLIDSACNNHQRFIRTQYEHIPSIVYEQNQWVKLNHYQSMESKKVMAFWEMYNRHILEIIQKIPAENLEMKCNSGMENPATLAWLINDYIVHLEHHLKQITDY